MSHPSLRLLDARVDAEPLDVHGLRRKARAVHFGVPGGVSGYLSRSYRHPLALVAHGPTPLGVDIEVLEPLDRAFALTICTPDELRVYDAGHAPWSLSGLWSAKEALSKALGDAIAYDPSRLPAPASWPSVDAVELPAEEFRTDPETGALLGPGNVRAEGVWRARELAPAPGHTGWLVWRASGLESASDLRKRSL